MKCCEFERRWQELLDGRQTPREDAELNAHALVCERCRDMLLIAQVLCDDRSERQPSAAPDFADRVVAAWRTAALTDSATSCATPRAHAVEIRPTRTSRRWTQSWLVTSAAALLILASSALLYRLSGSLTAPAEPLASNAPLQQQQQQQDSTQMGRPAGTRPSDLDAPVGEQLVAYQELLDSLSTRFPTLPLESVDDITGSLRPVADSVGRALDALRRTLPLRDRSAPHDKPQARYTPAHVIA